MSVSETSSFEITKLTRRAPPSVPFKKIAAAILPRGYKLSLVLCGDTLSQRINREYRKKDYVPNVLSFPLEHDEGEIFLNLGKAAKEATAFGISARSRTALLFVHGCFHLLGMRHGESMERRERQILKKFGF